MKPEKIGVVLTYEWSFGLAVNVLPFVFIRMSNTWIVVERIFVIFQCSIGYTFPVTFDFQNAFWKIPHILHIKSVSMVDLICFLSLVDTSMKVARNVL